MGPLDLVEQGAIADFQQRAADLRFQRARSSAVAIAFRSASPLTLCTSDFRPEMPDCGSAASSVLPYFSSVAADRSSRTPCRRPDRACPGRF